jgi:hypothetical protein
MRAHAQSTWGRSEWLSQNVRSVESRVELRPSTNLITVLILTRLHMGILACLLRRGEMYRSCLFPIEPRSLTMQTAQHRAYICILPLISVIRRHKFGFFYHPDGSSSVRNEVRIAGVNHCSRIGASCSRGRSAEMLPYSTVDVKSINIVCNGKGADWSARTAERAALCFA